MFKRQLPKIFLCPHCGTNSVRVAREEQSVRVTCGSCGIAWELTGGRIPEPVDVYNQFVDKYNLGEVARPG